MPAASAEGNPDPVVLRFLRPAAPVLLTFWLGPSLGAAVGRYAWVWTPRRQTS